MTLRLNGVPVRSRDFEKLRALSSIFYVETYFEKESDKQARRRATLYAKRVLEEWRESCR